MCSNVILDVSGLRCPETIMMIRKMIREIDTNETLLIITDDITMKRDIYLYCIFMKHQFIRKYVNYLPYKFLIKKLH